MDNKLKYSLGKICRICLMESSDMIDIFQPGYNNIVQAITIFSEIKLSNNDYLPKRVCNECAMYSNTVLYFKQKCLNSDIKLKEYLLNESSFRNEELLMDLNDMDYFQYETMPTEPLFPSPRQEIMECAVSPKQSFINTASEIYNFICYICQNSFKNCSDLVNHVVLNHSNTKILVPDTSNVCDLCGSKLDSKFDCSKHKASHPEMYAPDEPISCPFCVELFSNLDYLQKHLDFHIENSFYKCIKCACCFITDDHLSNHNKISHIEVKDSKELSMDIMDDSYSFLDKDLDLDLSPNVDSNNLNNSFMNQTVTKCITDYDAEKVLSEVLESVGPIETYIYSKCKKDYGGHEQIENNLQSEDEQGTHKNKNRKPCGQSTPVKKIEIEYNCHKCPKSFLSSQLLERHEARHSEIMNCLCSNCGMGFQTQSKLMEHSKTHDRNTAIEENGINLDLWTICEKDIGRASNLSPHIEKHSIKPSFVCEICNKYFHKSVELKRHKRHHVCKNLYLDAIEIYPPNHKDKKNVGTEDEFEKREILTEDTADLLMKGQTKPPEQNTQEIVKKMKHICGLCGKSFRSLKFLKKHEIRHTGVKDILCSECGMGFTIQSLLVRHVNKMHNKKEEIYTCLVCSKNFPQANQLKCHMKTHTTNKNSIGREKANLACTVCKKYMSSSSNLSLHMRRHLGNNPYICRICGAGYPRPTDLKLHMRHHTGEKPYQCSECQASFKRSDSLNIHMRVHTNERPYKCCHCFQGFKQISDLKKHENKKVCQNRSTKNEIQIQSNTKIQRKKPYKQEAVKEFSANLITVIQS